MGSGLYARFPTIQPPVEECQAPPVFMGRCGWLVYACGVGFCSGARPRLTLLILLGSWRLVAEPQYDRWRYHYCSHHTLWLSLHPQHIHACHLSAIAVPKLILGIDLVPDPEGAYTKIR